MSPFEFIIEGPPISQQTRNRKRRRKWVEALRVKARAVWPKGVPPISEPVHLEISYYYEGEPLDTDNMIKPIQDALIGVAYDDDKRVTDVTAKKRSLDSGFRIKDPSPVLVSGLAKGREFLYVKVTLAVH